MLVVIFRPILILLSTMLCLLLLSACSKEPEAVAPQAFYLNSENQAEFVGQLVGDYLASNEELSLNFLKYSAAKDAEGFIRYRNSSWTLKYIGQKEFYQKMLHLNKAYIYRHQINALFDRFMDLQKLSLHLKHSLQNSDENLAAQAMEKLSADRKSVEDSWKN